MYELRAPARELASYIEHYWFVGATGPEPFELRVDVFVDARADLIFNFGAPYVREVIGGGRRKIARSNLDAQRLVPIRIAQRGRLRTTGVRFRLGGLGPFAQASLGAATGTTSAPQRWLGADAIALERALKNCFDADEQALILDDFFRARLALTGAFGGFARTLAHAVERGGAARAADLAAAAGTSYRHVERLFARYLGISPRALARVLRFQSALAALMRDERCNLSRVAASAGYFDQAHFVREFKKMTGGVPRGYRGYFPPQGPADFAPNVVVFVQDRRTDKRYPGRGAGRSDLREER